MPCTLWQQRQQTAYCAGRLLLRASFNVLPLPSHIQPRCTPISTVCVCEGPWVQATAVLVPLLIPFLSQDPLLPLILHPPSVIPRISEVRKRAERRDCFPACTGLEQLYFISQARRIRPNILLPAA